MTPIWRARTLALASLGACFLYMALTAHALPDHMATHFDIHGNPDGWSSKTAFFISFPLTVVGTNLFLLLLMPAIVTKIPKRFVNIPHKDYWLATPERIAHMDRAVTTLLTHTAFYTNIVFLFGYRHIVQENTPDPLLRLPFNTWLIGLLAFTVLYMTWLLIAFYREMKPSE